MRRATTGIWGAGAVLLLLGLIPRGPVGVVLQPVHHLLASPCPEDATTRTGSAQAPALRAAGGLEFRPGAVSYLRAASGTATGPAVLAARGPALAEAADRGAAVQNPTIVKVTYSGFTDEARAAFQFAVDVWKAHVSSPVPITISASFQSLGTGLLGGASPVMFVRDRGPQGPWYPIALANAVQGRTLLPGTPDIVAQFTSDPSIWYFGTDDAPPADRFDFATVVLHELGHGLGMTGDFSDEATGIGAFGQGQGKSFPTIFDTFVANAGGQVLVDEFPNNSAELGSQLTGGSLTFKGPAAMRATGGVPPALFAPPVWQEGTSAYHVDPTTYPIGSPNSLMGPALLPGMAIHDPGPVLDGLFQDLGWPAALPGPPVDVTAEAGDRQISVVWQPPAHISPPEIVSYVVAFGPAGALPATAVPSGSPAGLAVLTGLTNGTAYEIRVAATNAVGTGPFSAPVVATPAAPAAHDVIVAAEPQSTTTLTAPPPVEHPAPQESAATAPSSTTTRPRPTTTRPRPTTTQAPTTTTWPSTTTTQPHLTPAPDPAAQDVTGPAQSATASPCAPPGRAVSHTAIGGGRRLAAAPQGSVFRGALAFTGEGFPRWLMMAGLGLLFAGETTRRTTIRRARGQRRELSARPGSGGTPRRDRVSDSPYEEVRGPDPT